MPWNLLILPLAAAYYILTRCDLFKYKQQRLDRQRLIFESVLLGSFLLAITISIKIVFDSIFPPFSAFLYKINPIKVNYLVTSVLTLVIAYLFTKVYNIWLSKDEEHIGDAIKEVGNEMDFLIRECFYDKEMILVTLNTGKFYVGYSESLPIPTVTKYIKLMPMLSGYRDERKMLEFTTHYTKLYADYSISKSIPDLEELNLKVILNFESIVSVSTFKLELYEYVQYKTSG